MLFAILFHFLAITFSYSQNPVNFLLCMHAGPPSNPSFFNHSLDLARDLGATGVRTDVFWSSIEPEYGNYSQQSIDFYYDYFKSCNEKGLNNSILIFSSPPNWAKTLWSDNRAAFLASFQKYISYVLMHIGIPLAIQKYQVWNEPNAIPSFHFWDDIPAILTVGGQTIKSMIPNSQILINPNCNFLFWATQLENWCDQSGEFFNSIGVDHYPGTWANNGWGDWHPLETVINMTNDRNSSCFGKKPNLLETGYSSFSNFFGHDEENQKLWMEESLILALEVVKKNKGRQFSVDTVAFYELWDEGDEWSFPPQEAHFGVVRKDGTQKPGYEALKKVMRKFLSN